MARRTCSMRPPIPVLPAEWAQMCPVGCCYRFAAPVAQVFPNVKVPPTQTRESYSECAMKGLSVKPKKGSAVAFWSLRTDGHLEQGSMHGSCPVIRGEKWSATKW
jgi:2OG-Fe(II) oxygenase superfamily